MTSFRDEVAAGKRFEFGKNWSSFLGVLTDERIREATKSLQEMLDLDRLDGLSFLDIGSGSGLFSLAARGLGARVFSFDYDPGSVACTRELKRRYSDGDPQWTIDEASVLDVDFMATLRKFDIVYAWGTLHHTGRMWDAIDLAAGRVETGGVLFIMIYLDKGWVSAAWRRIKRLYCSSFVGRSAVLAVFIPYIVTRGLILDLCKFRNPVRRYTEYKKRRGMSKFHDMVDWLGGYPYEYAKLGDVISFLMARGFVLRKLRHTEYVFRKVSESRVTFPLTAAVDPLPDAPPGLHGPA